MPSYRKIKTVAKTIVPKGVGLDEKILKTMKAIADIVGATLGPGGCPVLIERQDPGLPNTVTKDGVTAFKALGFRNEVEHAIMETARDASVRTAIEAGDGTTTATVLAEAFVRRTHMFCRQNPKVSPQRVVRTIEKIFREDIEPYVKKLAIKPEEIDEETIRSVARCSANGDDELANAIMNCFEVAGDDGNITLIERSGPSGYEVEVLSGYPVTVGFEDSCKRFFPLFINDQPNHRVYMEKPLFVLYFGTITEIHTLYPIMQAIGTQWEHDRSSISPNIVIVACGFSETVIGHLSANWTNPETLNIYPLVIPKSPINNGELHFLQDIQAVTGSNIFDPVSRPIEKGGLTDIGQPLDYFESLRYRSNIVGRTDEGLLLARVEQLQLQAKNPESELEKRLLDERIGKLTGGIAKLTVIGPSSGEIREKRDRAEDASCAVRGARKHGCLPGSGWTLMKVMRFLESKETNDSVNGVIIREVMLPALETPIIKLMENAGLNDDEIIQRLNSMYNRDDGLVWDGVTDTFVDAKTAGIVDSTPAVLEAIRNSISVATLLGTLGGVIVWPRDDALERQESSDTYQWLKDAGYKVNE